MSLREQGIFHAPGELAPGDPLRPRGEFPLPGDPGFADRDRPDRIRVTPVRIAVQDRQVGLHGRFEGAEFGPESEVACGIDGDRPLRRIDGQCQHGADSRSVERAAAGNGSLQVAQWIDRQPGCGGVGVQGKADAGVGGRTGTGS